jgi:hypothetical protein
VVIAIVAILRAILMPALQRVKKQAKVVACQSNLRQWCPIFSMYLDDNKGYFMEGYAGKARAEPIDNTWVGALRPYYKEPKIRVCPTATKPMTEGGRGAFSAWDVFGVGAGDPRRGLARGKKVITAALWDE